MEITDLWKKVDEVCQTMRACLGEAYVVGGAARDLHLARNGQGPLTIKDVDIEVFGLSSVQAETYLKTAGFLFEKVGKSFGVYKLRGVPIDISLPRREVKTGEEHTDFLIEIDPHMDLYSAAQRRDFTINAIYWDPLNDKWYDPHGGRKDMADRVLRPTSSKFGEDPLRVLRGMQFIARFGLTATPECIAACQQLGQENLSRERLWGEWKKLILHGKYFTAAFDFLRDVGWMEKYYPELFALIGSQQNPIWHPEGNCHIHNCLVLEAFGRGTFKDEEEKLVLGLASICHDLGKPHTAVFGPTPKNPEPHWTNKGHENYLPPTDSFLARLTNEPKLIEEVRELVKAHMKPSSFYKNKADASAFRRLALTVDLQKLEKLARFDQGGRGPTKPPEEEELAWFRTQAEQAKVFVSKPVPLVLGRHLLSNFNLKPGVRLGEVLKALMEKQLAGEFDTLDGGLQLVPTLLNEDEKLQSQ